MLNTRSRIIPLKILEKINEYSTEAITTCVRVILDRYEEGYINMKHGYIRQTCALNHTQDHKYAFDHPKQILQNQTFAGFPEYYILALSFVSIFIYIYCLQPHKSK